jgi:hypothetical protein
MGGGAVTGVLCGRRVQRFLQRFLQRTVAFQDLGEQIECGFSGGISRQTAGRPMP